MTDDPQPEKRSTRRALLITGVGAAGVLAGAAGTKVVDARTHPGAATAPADATLPPSEDLMREHGVLKRVLLIYRAMDDQIAAGHRPPADALADAAKLIHDFIEGFHEGLEEAYVFPRLQAAGRHVDTVRTLLTQHAAGRRITQRVLQSATTAKLRSAAARQATRRDLASFVRMYEPHEAREDTVIFPTFRAITPAAQFVRLGEQFANMEADRFGTNSFTDMVTTVAQIERSLGIDNLADFTPAG
ncbi:hemerythrin domain-containing protein [Actinocatenispora comari]|uniref:Hemerythrin-like domain-containing protein n=1 Tax=Actinocatenispora comari TaxID=2807577 RepID=A0A8J4A5P1_9ACTN|nr:hemerythrin domain-containing protein [Actinocatenispora comari]GIL25351.1 hypothetical protein NUM_06060 [Actinocatenispora comari]